MKIKKFILSKKKSGFLDDYLPLFAFILVAIIAMMGFIEVNTAINKKSDINSIARQYVLRMETQGCLKNSDITELITSLNAAGFSDSEGGALSSASFDCVYSGQDTNGESVGYGNVVTLKFKVYTKQWMMDAESLNSFTGIFKKGYAPISIEYHSTSKE